MSIFVLKIIALVTMTVDHIGAMGIEVAFGDYVVPNMLLRCIGRISFPLFAFCMGIGLKYTRDIFRHTKRLLVFALVSEIPFLAVYVLPPQYRSGLFSHVFITVMVTFLASSVACLLHKMFLKEETAWKKVLYIALIAGVFFLCNVLDTDYGALGAMLAFFIYLAPKKIHWLGITAFFMFAFYGVGSLFYWSLASLVGILFYNGKKGHSMKWFFYAYYPLHFVIIGVCSFLIDNFKI